MPDTPIIIGAGLAGLATAYYLQQRGINPLILEARSRVGGRMYTHYQAGKAPVELGATWFGKKHVNLVRLLEELSLSAFEQRLGQTAFYEPISTSPPQLVQLPPNDEPSYRIQGGSSRLIEALVSQLPADAIQLNAPVVSLSLEGEQVLVQTKEHQYRAKQVINTLPPRLFQQQITCEPALPAAFLALASATHTWMGESIKVALTFAQPFWRETGLSGTIFSNVGPISEFYDHSDVEDAHYALKGFLNGAYFAADRESRLQVILRQLRKYYGDKVNDYLSYEEYVWRNDAWTFAAYEGPILPHQHNGDPRLREALWEGHLWMGGSETAQDFPGYMDGAVQRAAEVAAHCTA